MDHLFIKGKKIITDEDKPIASSQTLGMIKIGTGITQDPDGTINVTGGGSDLSAEDTFYLKGHVASEDLLPGDYPSYESGTYNIADYYDNSFIDPDVEIADPTLVSGGRQYYVILKGVQADAVQILTTDYPEQLYYYTNNYNGALQGILVKYDSKKPVYTTYPSNNTLVVSDYVVQQNATGGAIRTNCTIQFYDPLEFMGDRYSSVDNYNATISVVDEFYSSSRWYNAQLYGITTDLYKVLEDESHYNYGPNYPILEPTSVSDDTAKIYYHATVNSDGDTYTVGESNELYRWSSNRWNKIASVSEQLEDFKEDSFNIKGKISSIAYLPQPQPSAGILNPAYSWNNEFGYKLDMATTKPNDRTHTYFLVYNYYSYNYGDTRNYVYMIETEYPEQIMFVENGSTFFTAGEYRDSYHKGFYIIYDPDKPVYWEGTLVTEDTIAVTTSKVMLLNFELRSYDPSKLSGTPTDKLFSRYSSYISQSCKKYMDNSNFYYTYPDGSKYWYGAGYKMVRPVSSNDYRPIVWEDDGTTQVGDTYLVGDTNILYRYNSNNRWEIISDYSNLYDFNALDIKLTDIQEELWGLPQNWIDEGTYLDRPYPFRDIASIKNVHTYKAIKITQYSQSLVDPVTTTLQPTGQMSIIDAGFDYDDLRAEWADPNETAPLSEIQESIYFKWS